MTEVKRFRRRPIELPLKEPSMDWKDTSSLQAVVAKHFGLKKPAISEVTNEPS